MENLIANQIPDDFTHYVKIYQNENSWCKIYINNLIYFVVNENHLLKYQPETPEEWIIYYVELVMIFTNAMHQFKENSYPFQVIQGLILDIRNYLKENEEYIYEASLMCNNVRFYFEHFENQKFKLQILKVKKENQLVKSDLIEFKEKVLKETNIFKREIGNLIKNLKYFKKEKSREIGIQTDENVKQDSFVQCEIEKIDKETQCNLKDDFEKKNQQLLNENISLRENLKLLKKNKKDIESMEKRKDKEIERIISKYEKEKNDLIEKSIKMNTLNIEKKIVKELRETTLDANSLYHILNNNNIKMVCNVLNVWFFSINANNAIIEYKNVLDGETVPFFKRFWVEWIYPELNKHQSLIIFKLLKIEWDGIEESFKNVNAEILPSAIDLIFFVHCVKVKAKTYSQLSFVPPFFSILFQECKNILRLCDIVQTFSRFRDNISEEEKQELIRMFFKLFIVKPPLEICYQYLPLLKEDSSVKVLLGDFIVSEK